MFIDGQTGIYLETERLDALPFPTISACFGYDHNVTKNPEMYDLFREKSAVTRDDYKIWWDKITQNPWNIVRKICLAELQTTKWCSTNESKSDTLTINEFSSYQGKCLKVTVSFSF